MESHGGDSWCSFKRGNYKVILKNAFQFITTGIIISQSWFYWEAKGHYMHLSTETDLFLPNLQRKQHKI